MYRASKHDKDTSMSRCSSSVLLETTNQLFEREIDSYTRMLEQDKRKFFRAQENRSEVQKHHLQKSRQLDSLMSRSYKLETQKKQGELKILERELDTTVNGYNEVLAGNKKLRTDIEQLRKARLTQKEVIKRLEAQIGELESEVVERKQSMGQKQQRAENNKQEILRLKSLNQQEVKSWRSEVTCKRDALAHSTNTKNFFRRSQQGEPKTETTDSFPLVKHRLRRMLQENKERQKIIENYTKTMESVRQTLLEISQEGTSSDLQDIASTIIKQEDQHQLAYTNIDKLNKDIDAEKEEEEQLRQAIEAQKQKNEEYRAQIKAGPKDLQERLAKQANAEECNQKIAEFQAFLEAVSGSIAKLGEEHPGVLNEEVNQFNLKSQLAFIEDLISQQYPDSILKESLPSLEMKAQASHYSKPAGPVFPDELKETREERLYSPDRLKEYAQEYWDKKKTKADTK